MSDEDKDQARRLLLLRHGKSAWPEGVEDRLRPIAGRGRKAVPLIGAFLERESLAPDLVLVSTAQRTQDTFELLRRHLAEGLETRFIDGLYEAPAERIAEILAAVEPEKRNLLIVGHNPGLQDLALSLIGSGEDAPRQKLAKKFPTAALAVIGFEAPDWHLAQGSGRLERFVTPKTLA